MKKEEVVDTKLLSDGVRQKTIDTTEIKPKKRGRKKKSEVEKHQVSEEIKISIVHLKYPVEIKRRAVKKLVTNLDGLENEMTYKEKQRMIVCKISKPNSVADTILVPIENVSGMVPKI